MFCHNCGKSVENGARFCPDCGTEIRVSNEGSHTVPLYHGNGVNPTAPMNLPQQAAPSAAGKAKAKKNGTPKDRKKLLKPVIALAVAAALIVTGIFAVPRLLRRGYDKDNVFASQMKDTKNDTSSRDVMTVFAAAHNTVFNSKSLSARVIVEGDELFDGSIVFGKDLASTKALIDLEDGEWQVALKDGKLMLVEYDDGMRIDVLNLLDDYKDLLDVVPWDELPRGMRSDADDEVETVKKAIDTLIENKINTDSADKLANSLYHVFDDQWFELSQYFDCEDLTLTDLFDLLADYISQIPDDLIKITTSKQDGAVKYKFKISYRDLMLSVLDYLSESDKAADILTSDIIQEAEDELEYFKDESSSAVLTGEVVVKGKYISKVVVGAEHDGNYYEMIRVTIDVDDVKIDDDDLEDVFKAVDKDDLIIIDDVDDLDALINDDYDYDYDDYDYYY